MGKWKNERQLSSERNENKDYEKYKEIKFPILGGRKNPVCLVRGLKPMSLERSFGFLVNAGEEAEVTKVLQRRLQKANSVQTRV